MIFTNKYRKGAASMYAVIFTTLLLAVTTTSFIRIVLRDTIQTSGVNASQAAYDAALIGIENMKIVLQKYDKCKNESATPAPGSECERLITALEDPEITSDCTLLARILFGDHFDSISSDFEIRVGEITTDDSGWNETETVDSEVMDQAITCVKTNQANRDYLARLTNVQQSKLVPLRTTELDAGLIQTIKVSWFSSGNSGGTGFSSNTNASLPKRVEDYETASNTSPSPLSIEFIQAGSPKFKLDEFELSKANGANTNSNVASLLLVPSSTATQSVIDANDFASTNDKSSSTTAPVLCNGGGGGNNYFCTALIRIPVPIASAIRNVGATFLRVAIPYGNPSTDFSVSLCKEATFAGCDRLTTAQAETNLAQILVQTTVESTGRSGDSFRRIQSRVEYVDTYFPLPMYALNTDAAIMKNSWATINNWGGVDYGAASGGDAPAGGGGGGGGGGASEGCPSWLAALHLCGITGGFGW